MIQYKAGDLLKEKTEGIVNTVNCVGIMGRGIALQFKKQYPKNFQAYAKACRNGEIKIGRVFVQEIGDLSGPKYVINFPTKKHWRGKSLLHDIERGLEDLARVVQELDIKSIAIPALGCGLGGLDWDDVKVRIENALGKLDQIKVVVFEPAGPPETSKMARSDKPPKMTLGRAALVVLMDKYIRVGLDSWITVLEIQKLMYFLQECGEKLNLRYHKCPYGPYAENLKNVLNEIEGHFTSGYGDGGDTPTKEIKIAGDTSQKATSFLENHQKTKQRCDRVFDLVEGFEDSFGLELLATVYWVVRQEDNPSFEQVINLVYDWGPSKKKFTERQIKIAYDRLKEKGWITA